MERHYPDSYLAFRIRFDLDAERWTYTVRAECALHRAAAEPAELSPRLAELARAATPVLFAERASSSFAGPSQPAMTSRQRRRMDALVLGGELYRMIFRGGVRDLYLQSRQHASDRGCGLRIELDLEPDSPLNSLPWELIHSPEDSYLGTDPTTPIVRCPATPRREPAEPGWWLGSLLIVAADPAGWRPLDLSEEIASIEEACRSCHVEVARAASSEPQALRQLIRDGNFDAIHFMGHAEFDDALALGHLILAGEDRRPQRLDAEAVARLVAARLPRLVVLNACSSALVRPGGSAFSGLTSALFQAGVPAVVGMQGPILNRPATRFGGRLYENLAQGRPIEAAVSEARLSLYEADPSDPRWAVPILFLPGAFGDPARTENLAPSRSLRRRLDQRFPRLHSALVTLRLLAEPPERGCLLEIGGGQLKAWKYEIEEPHLGLWAEPVPISNPTIENAVREGDPFSRNIQVDIRRLIGLPAAGDDPAALGSSVRRGRPVPDIDRILRQDQGPLVLVGPPGSGKTQALVVAARDLTLAERHRVYPRIVIFVRLGEFSTQGRKPGPRNVAELVRRYCPPELRAPAPTSQRPSLDELSSAGRLIVLFDGLNEMSRDGYIDRIRALSLFAYDLEQRGGRCIFTCRVDEFASMPHRRLALLPFDSLQIDRYLRRQFPHRGTYPVQGKRWKPRRFARYLAADSPHLGAGNPLNLFLLCKFLASRGVLPASRAEMFEQFFRSRYASRVAETDRAGEPRLPAEQAVFHTWSRFAWLISERNLGSAIDEKSLHEDAAGARDGNVGRMIRAGTLCGVLRETMEEKQCQIRFTHHQYQEYFAARWIHQRKEAIDWLAKLDAPRWQETMFDLVMLGGGEEALAALSAAVSRETAAQRAAVAAREAWKPQKADPAPPADPAPLPAPAAPELPRHSAEAALADRVVLGARLVQQVGAGSPAGHRLRPPVLDAVRHLVVHGRPDSQVKMLEAWRALDDSDPALADPELDAAVKTARQSPVRWVRDKAVLLTSDLPAEAGVDLATSELLPRLSVFLRRAYAGGGAGDWLALATATLLGVAHLAAMLGLSLALSRKCLEDLIGIEREFKEPVITSFGPWAIKEFSAAQAALTLGVLLFALVSRPRRAWLWCFGTVPVGCAAGYAALAVSQTKFAPIGIAELLVMVLAFGLPVVAGGCALLHLAVLAAYSFAVPRRAGSPAIAELMGTAWRDCGYGSTIGAFFFVLLLGIVGGGAHWGAEWLGDRLGALLVALGDCLYDGSSRLAVYLREIGVGPSAVLLTALGLGALSMLLRAVRRWLRRVARALPQIAAAMGCLATIGVFFVLSGPLVDGVVDTARWLWDRTPGRNHIAPAMLLVASLLAARVGLIHFLRWLQAVRPSAPPAQRSSTPEAWKARLDAASPSQQKVLLHADHHSLGLSPRTFLRLLDEVYPLLKEPVQDAYWQRLYEVGQAARQERTGSEADPALTPPTLP